jgi:hypothetical protein
MPAPLRDEVDEFRRDFEFSSIGKMASIASKAKSFSVNFFEIVLTMRRTQIERLIQVRGREVVEGLGCFA